MDEKNQNTNQYTGEYGNPVERTDNQETSGEQESSIYSYSYKDHRSEATSSGDYRAEDNVSTVNTSGTDSAGSAQGQQDGAGTEPFWSQAGNSQAESRKSADVETGWGQADDSQTESREENAGARRNREKKSGLTAKKIASCAGLAVVFGVIAAVCFQGVCYFSSHVLGINVSAVDTKVGYTTDNVNYTEIATQEAVGTTDVSGIARQTMPSIVAITSTEEGQNYYDLFGQYYQGQDTTSCGSGFIVGKNDKELLIATNNHVVEGAKTISVQFFDDEVYEATAKGTDSAADLAVIAVKLADVKSSTMKSIRIASLGDSSEAKVGEMVVAIGNALGYGQSVTVGYISAKDREIREDSSNPNSSTMKVIQTDAAINPGNSGGALMNMRGEVIGINSAKIADSSVEGMGYAIPISEATPIIDELMNKEVLTDSEKGYLGISGKTVSETVTAYGMPEGVYVAEVAEGGAAQKAGIKQGDVITAINDVTVTTIESLKEKANSYKKGTTVSITLKRNNNGVYEEKKVDVVLQGEESLNSLPDSTASANGGSGNSGSGNDDSRNGENGNNSDDGNGSDNGNGEGNGGDDQGDYSDWGNMFPWFGGY